MALDLSLGEFQSLVAKALRGAGYQWGLAADGAYASRVLAQHGLPAADIVSRVLSDADIYGLAEVSVDDMLDSALPVCPITCGAALSDLGELALRQVANIVGSSRILEPLMLAPFLEDCKIMWPEGHATISSRTIEVHGALPRGSHLVELIQLDEAVVADKLFERATRAIVLPETHLILEQFAHRTYAPATEASRQGAGEDAASP